MLFYFAAQFVQLLIPILSGIIILYAVCSFFVPPGSENALMRLLSSLAEPILNPLRRVIPSMGGLDLSPMVAIILLQIVGRLVVETLISSALVR